MNGLAADVCLYEVVYRYTEDARQGYEAGYGRIAAVLLPPCQTAAGDVEHLAHVFLRELLALA